MANDPNFDHASAGAAATVRVAETEPTPRGLTVSFRGPSAPAAASFAWFWLRDHCEDADSLDAETLQRKVDTFALSPAIAGTAEIVDAGAALSISWADGARPTRITAELLARVAGPSGGRGAEVEFGPRRLWRAGDLPAPGGAWPLHAFEAVVETDAGLSAALRDMHRFGFAVFDGATPSEAATERLAGRFGYVRRTIFGDMWRLSAEMTDHGDSAYTTQFLEPHTDGTYSLDAPGLQMFNCLAYDAKGGESVLVDGFALAEDLRRADPGAYELLTEVSVPARYVEPGVHLTAERPALRLDAFGALEQISFNNYDRAPFVLPQERMDAFYAAYGALHARIADQANWLKIPLRPGMALIFDNWRLLHGRMGFAGKRVFYGCYHNREDFLSRLRSASAA